MTTTTGTPVTCPPSAVHDMIVQWFLVAEGDLVLHDGQFHVLERMWPTLRGNGSEVGIELLREGVPRRYVVDSNAWTAVRRYDTREG